MNNFGELIAFSVALLWSVSAFLFTELIGKLGTIIINILRLVISAVLIFITISVFNIDILPSYRQIIFLVLSGIIGLALGDTFLFKSFNIVGPRVGTLIYSINPAIAAVIAYIFLNEGLSFLAVCGITITLSGIFLVVMDKKPQRNDKFKITGKGIFFSLLAGLGQAVGLVFAKEAFYCGNINGLTATLYRMVPAILILFPYLAAKGRLKKPIMTFGSDRKLIGLMLLASFLGTYLGITLSFVAVVHTEVGIASTIMSTIPILMLPLSKFIYKEKLSWRSIFGAFIAVIGIAVIFLH